jgi:hypothetical protein
MLEEPPRRLCGEDGICSLGYPALAPRRRATSWPEFPGRAAGVRKHVSRCSIGCSTDTWRGPIDARIRRHKHMDTELKPGMDGRLKRRLAGAALPLLWGALMLPLPAHGQAPDVSDLSDLESHAAAAATVNCAKCPQGPQGKIGPPGKPGCDGKPGPARVTRPPRQEGRPRRAGPARVTRPPRQAGPGGTQRPGRARWMWSHGARLQPEQHVRRRAERRPRPSRSPG